MVEGLHLSSRHREEIEALLRKHLPGVEVWAYGSRVNGRSHDGSDLDLVLRGPKLAEIDTSRLADFIEALQDSTIPFLVEARDWSRLPESFHREIEREHVVLVEREERNVSDEWPVKTVQQLVEEGIMERPMDGNHGEVHPKSSDFLRDGIPFIMASNVSGGRVDTKNCAFISEDQARSLRKGFSITGDVLISHKATMGRTALVGRLDVPFIMLTPQVTYYRVIDKGQLDPKYLKNYFDSPAFQQLFETWGQKGSTRSYLGITSQLDLPIVVPPPDVQKSIAHILGTLDDKIELNRRMNETLEAMARALFKSWFVNFDPVRAKMEGRDTGLPQDLADLFPDRLVDSELGEIPEGWGVESLEMIAQLEKATVKPEDHTTEEFEHFSLPAYDSGQLPALDLGSTIKSNKTLVPSQAVLLSKLNPEIQRVWLPASASSCRQISSTEFLVFTPKPPIGRAGLYSLFNTQSFRDLLKGMVTGTSKSHQRVAPKSLAMQAMIVPADRLANKFEGFAWPMLERTLRNKSENHTLTALRDTLLPKLISGEIRIRPSEVQQLMART